MRRQRHPPQATEFGRPEMRGWYRERDLLLGGIEQVIPAANSLEATMLRIMGDSSLTGQPQEPTQQR